LSPAVEHQSLQGLIAGDGRQIRADPPAGCESSVQDEMCDSPGIPYRVLDRDGATLRYSEQRKPIESGCCNHRFQIADIGVERNALDIPVRQTVAARIVSDKAAISSEPAKHVTPDRTVPVVLEMVEPVCCLDERRSLPHGCICNANSVARSAESYF